jgi:endonuclease I
VKKNTTVILLLLSLNVIAGTITKSVSSLYFFGNVYPFHSSTAQRYTLSATSLTANLVITADNGFEVSTTYGYGYGKSITLTPASGTIASTTVFVRFSPSATGSASGSIVNSSVGSTTQNVTVTGTCVSWAIPTSPSNYYSTSIGRGSTLKTNLSSKISGHTAVPYGSGTTCTNCVWGAFVTTDVQPNGKVWDVYSTLFDQASPYEYTMRSDQCGTYSVEGDCYNREHSFPQSWFNSSTPMVSDLFHVFASDGKVNGMRNNYPFGTVSSPTFTSLYGGKLGPNTSAGYSGTTFEPNDEYKGDIARAQLYMATRYESSIAGWQSNGNADDVLSGNSFPAYDTWYIDLLVAWHNQDPVSDKEIKRNNAIHAIQSNRNPYIDSPQFVQRIWGGAIPAEPTISASNLTITNVSNTSVTLDWKSGNGNRRIVVVKAAAPVSSFPTDTFHYGANSNLTLAPQLSTGNYIVYNGTGSSVTITNMIQNTAYQYAVIEYNGWYTMANYQSSGILTGGGTTLPVDLTSFTAEKLTDTEVLLKWTTASEYNNNYFTIERSVDTLFWDSIAAMDGAGTSTRINNYQFLDTPSIPSGYIYYRLKQTDFDGNFTYSNTVSVDFGTTGLSTVPYPQITITPNPFHNQFTVSANGLFSNEVTLFIQNIMGETILQYQIPVYNGKINYSIPDADAFPSGMYFVHLKHNQNSQFAKLIKQ